MAYSIKSLTLAAITIIFTALLSGCGNENPKDLQDFVKENRQAYSDKAKSELKDIPQLPKSSTYQSAGFRSPFSATGVIADSSVAAKSPLQAYPISVLKLVGTINEGAVTFAYIATPDQMIYQVNKGDLLGDRGGKVTGIETGRVMVMEEEREEGKPPVQHLVTLELKDEQQ